MPLQPLTITLSDGQKVEALKRFRAKYHEEVERIESDLAEILTAVAEAEFLAQYIGEQPEVVSLKERKAEADKLEKRRQHIGLILDRLDQVIPKQQEVKVPVPSGARPGAAAPPPGSGIRRY